jgi:hypothetical protein
MSDYPRPPPILRLPSELHVHIVSFLTTDAPKYCLIDNGPEVLLDRRAAWYEDKYAKAVHNAYSNQDDEPIAITHASVLSLRLTNTYFLNLIPLSQDLLLRIERHPSTPWTSIGTPKACCVCLRLRPSNEFAMPDPSHIANSHVVQSLQCGARYRFCRDCGFHAYPHPHPALSPRQQQRQRGTEPVQLTTYRPGTKLFFPRMSARSSVSFDTWVWCMDCGLLKTSTAAGEIDCPLFCAECCTRIGCRITYHPSSGARILHYRHRGYAGIEEEVTAEKQRREYRLSAGAVYVAQGRSLLLKNVEQPVDDQEEEDSDYPEHLVCKEWFDLQGYATILHTPPSYWRYLPGGPPGKRRLPPGTIAICCARPALPATPLQINRQS